MLFEAYAAVREARVRESDQRMFDVQLMGGIVLHEGDVAEMKTGEGKTFVASLALYLNALPTVTTLRRPHDRPGRAPRHGQRLPRPARRRVEPRRLRAARAERRVHRDADAVRPAQDRLRGRHHLRHELRVRLRLPPRQHVDLARGPRPARPSVRDRGRGRLDPDRRGADAADHLRRADDRGQDLLRLRARREDPQRRADRRTRRSRTRSSRASTTSSSTRSTRPSRRPSTGIDKVERMLKIEHLYDPRNVQLVNHLSQSLKAEALYKRDVDYVIEDGEVKIVDEFTGRIMEGRRWSEGLHQAVEAKEGVAIQEEHQTLATITLQNYFRLYEKLAGMTGTAKTEEKEFVEIYGLDVIPIPTNVGVARKDENDLIFKTKEAKFAAVAPTSRSATRPASRSSSARSRSRPPSTSPSCSSARACRTTSSTRRSTRARPRSSRTQARSARSRSRRTWPAAASTSRSTTRCASSAASTSSAPSATSRAASTTSSAAAPAARATRARRASTSPARTTSCACSRATGSTTSWSASSSRRISPWRRRSSRTRSRTRRRRSRSRTSSSARTSSSTTT